MDLVVVETDQSLGSVPTRIPQETPTSPEMLFAEMPEGRRGATSGEVGSWALLPMILIRFHHTNAITILGK